MPTAYKNAKRGPPEEDPRVVHELAELDAAEVLHEVRGIPHVVSPRIMPVEVSMIV